MLIKRYYIYTYICMYACVQTGGCVCVYVYYYTYILYDFQLFIFRDVYYMGISSPLCLK